MTKARIVICPTLSNGTLSDTVRYAVEFKKAFGWARYQGQTFVTWVGAAGWIASQGAELID